MEPKKTYTVKDVAVDTYFLERHDADTPGIFREV